MKTKLFYSFFSFLAGCMVMTFFFGSGNFIVEAKESKVVPQEESVSKEKPFFIMNALWFKEDGGEAKYSEYMKAAAPFVIRHGGKPGQAYIPELNMIGEFDADLMFFVEWPNQKAFLEFVQDPGYQAISHLRGEAIRDSLLIRCRRAGDKPSLVEEKQ